VRLESGADEMDLKFELLGRPRMDIKKSSLQKLLQPVAFLDHVLMPKIFLNKVSHFSLLIFQYLFLVLDKQLQGHH